MESVEWMRATVGDHSQNAVATAAQVQQSTLNRQIARGLLAPETVVAIARAYRVPVLPGLVACGLITTDEAALKDRMGALEEALADATDAELLRAILKRVAGGVALDSILTAPLDATHPMLRSVPDLADLAADASTELTDFERFDASQSDDPA